jgi:hypothetical protein
VKRCVQLGSVTGVEGEQRTKDTEGRVHKDASTATELRLGHPFIHSQFVVASHPQKLANQ